MPIPADALDANGFHPYGARTRPEPWEWQLTDAEALVTRIVYDRLLSYDSTVPTGLYLGKVWKRRDADGEWLGEVVLSATHPDTHVTIKWRRLRVRHPICDGEDWPVGIDMFVIDGKHPFKGYARASGACGEVPADQRQEG